MTLGSTQRLIEMSTRSISWGLKRPVCRADNLYVPIVLKCGSLNLLIPSGPLQACNGIGLPLLSASVIYNIFHIAHVSALLRVLRVKYLSSQFIQSVLQVSHQTTKRQSPHCLALCEVIRCLCLNVSDVMLSIFC